MLIILEVLLLLFLGENNAIGAVPLYNSPQRPLPNIKSMRETGNFKNYVNTYLNNLSLRGNPFINQQVNSLYNLPEYEPVYQEGYLTRRPKIKPEILEALMPYVHQDEPSEYLYDYNTASYNPYTEDEDDGQWYDTPVGPQETNVDNNNQEAALFKLLLDHLAGKYSLEDLETLERQEAIDENVENQLQSLLQSKNANLYPKHYRARKTMVKKEEPVNNEVKTGDTLTNGGQKEVPALLPSLNRPSYPQFNEKYIPEPSSSTRKIMRTTAEPVTQTTGSTEDSSSPRTTSSVPEPHKPVDIQTTMDPSVQEAYQAFKNLLDRERYLRRVSDEASMNTGRQKTIPQRQINKRFVTDPKSLTKQLSNLKTRTKI